jgi:hypothetical protein
MPFKSDEDRRVYQRKHWKKYYNKTKHVLRVKERAKRTRAWLAEYKKTLSCSLCGENHPACLDFHHRDPSDKNGHVTDLINRNCSIATIQKEIAKCDVLCGNCHRKLHWNLKYKS